ncbi:MAG TPA: response regulator [Solirubrobacteraceae bacterium]|jgi:NarL family two-component system response regulator LiaR
MIRVFHCDDSIAYRRLVRAMLETEPDIELVGEAASHAEALSGVASTQPDVVLLDMVVGLTEDDYGAALAAAAPGARVLILSGHPPERVAPDLRALAVGHVRKSTAFDELAGAVRAAAAADSTNVR